MALLSFALSMWLWLYVQAQEFPTDKIPTFFTVKIELRNVPDDIVPADPGSLRFFPRGMPDDIRLVKPEDLSAYVDLSGARPDPGDNTRKSFPVHLVVNGHDSVTWGPPKPSVTLRIQAKLTKRIKVRVQPSGELPNPDHIFLPLSTYTEPAEIEVSGPESDVRDVDSARVILNLAGVAPGGPAPEGEIEILQGDDRPAPSTVLCDVRKVAIHPGIGVGLEFVRLPVRVNYNGTPAPGFVVKQVIVTPADVQVRGRSGDLRGLTHLEMDPDIDIAGLKESTTFTLTPRLPQQGVALVGQPTITAKFVIEPAPKAPATTPNTTRRRGGE
jgi:YbbR domain-containing protein